MTIKNMKPSLITAFCRHASTHQTKRDRLEMIPLSNRWEEIQNEKFKRHRRRIRLNPNEVKEEPNPTSSLIPSSTTEQNEVQDTVHAIVSNISKNLKNVQKLFFPFFSKKDDSFSSSFNSLNVSSLTSYLHPRIRNRIGPTMDSTWWFYNIFIALLPAVGIAFLCESYQQEMNDFYIMQQDYEKQKFEFLLQEEEKEGGGGGGGGTLQEDTASSSVTTDRRRRKIDKGHEVEAVMVGQQVDDPMGSGGHVLSLIYTQVIPVSVQLLIQNVYDTIIRYYPFTLLFTKEEEEEHESSRDYSHNSITEYPSSHSPAPSHDYSNGSTSSIPTKPNDETANIQSNHTNNMNNNTRTNHPETLESLLMRIQHLENITNSSHGQKEHEPRENDHQVKLQQQQQQRLDYYIKRRINQSGIRNRYEDQLLDTRIHHLHQQEQQLQQHDLNSSSSSSPTNTHPTFDTVTDAATHLSTTNIDSTKNIHESRNDDTSMVLNQDESNIPSSSSSNHWIMNSYNHVLQYIQEHVSFFNNDSKKRDEDEATK